MIDLLLIGLAHLMKNPPESNDDFYFEIELTRKQREVVLRMCESKQKGIPVVALEAVKSAVLDARKVEGRLPRARLDWAAAEKAAKERGESVADWLSDAPWEADK